MKQLFSSFLLLISFAVCVSAQTKEAQKFNEFVPANCEVAMALLDAFGVQLASDLEATGYIIFYDGKITKNVKKNLPMRGEARLIAKELERYLKDYKKMPKNRFVIIDGGFREENSVELWIAPSNSAPPKPTPTIKKVKYRRGTPGRICSEMF